MAVTWRYSSGTPTSWSAMLDTAFFDDGIPGDTSTFEQAVAANSFYTRPTRQAQTARALLWAQGYLQQSHILTGVNFSCWTARGWYPVNPECVVTEDEPTNPTESGVYTVSVWDGAAFVQVDTGALAVTQSPSTAEYFTVSSTFAAVTTCWVIVTVAYDVSVVSCEGELIATAGISDIRPQGSNTGITCAEGSPPSPGPTPTPIPDPGGDPGGSSGAIVADRSCTISGFVPPDRTCVLAAGAVSAKSEVFVAPPSDVYLIDADGTYLVDSDQTYLIDQN